MTETITIDGLPEGYTVITTPHYHDLRYRLKRLVATRSTRYKKDKTAEYFLKAAKAHATQMQRDNRRAAEKAFCEDYTDDQLEAVSMKEMWEVIELCAYAITTFGADDAKEEACGLLDKFKTTEDQS